MQSDHDTLGELIQAVYEELLEVYGDEDLAAVAAAAMVNELLSARRSDTEERTAA